MHMKYSSSERGQRPLISAHISACGGDRKDALLRTISGPIQVDTVSGDYLAELNLAWLSSQMAADPSKGYEQSFLPQFKLAANKYIEHRKNGRDIKIAVNAGGLRPQQLAQEIRNVLDSYGPIGQEVKVAWIIGDDVLDLVKGKNSVARGAIRHLSHGTSYDDWGYEPITANAYIGCFGIVEALEKGADIIISGRTTDAGAHQAFGRWWHGWKEDDFDNLALTLVTGHIIECGTYAVASHFFF
jgi:Acyclic terpene utilisation family protein AtuA